MKRLILILIACLLLSGCGWMDGDYVSVTPHMLSGEQDAEDLTVISSYSQLRTALTDLVDKGEEYGLFFLADYPQERLNTDVALAVSYARSSYPIGAYAVEDMKYEYGSGGGLNTLSVEIRYRHGPTEINRIQTVRGIRGAESAIAAALKQCSPSLVLQITGYEETDFAQLTADYAADHPEAVMETPATTFQVWPATGDVRVVELVFSYQTSRESLRTMQENVQPIFASAELYVTSDADEATKFAQLYTFLMERFDYTIETSITPSYSLLCHGVGDSRAFAQVYAAMCRQAGLQCMVVSGTRSGESHFWNMVVADNICYHVDLLRSAQEGGYAQWTDEEMQGYVWDYSAYPSGGERIEPEPELPERYQNIPMM